MSRHIKENMKSQKAIKECAGIMVKMLDLGWTKDALPELEKLFWRCRDHQTGLPINQRELALEWCRLNRKEHPANNTSLSEILESMAGIERRIGKKYCLQVWAESMDNKIGRPAINHERLY